MFTMDPTAGFDALVAGITFSGSLLSFLATTAVLICFVYYRHEQQSFRHALVFNLALAGRETPPPPPMIPTPGAVFVERTQI